MDNDFTVWALIGNSSFAKSSIYLCKDANSSFVSKRTNLEHCRSSLQLGLLANEIKHSKSLRHKNILSIQNAFLQNGFLHVRKELMDLGSCFDLMQVKYKHGFPENCISLIISDVLKAVEYIHSLSYIHRGIKGSHILISSQGTVKLSGHRSLIPMIEYGIKNNSVHHYPKDEMYLLPWLSPEILQQNKQGYSYKSDIYSVGITAVELGNGHAPFTDMPTTQMLLEKLNGTMPYLLDMTTIPENMLAEIEEESEDNELTLMKKAASQRKFSDAFHEFCHACLQKETEARPFLYVLQNHEFLQHKNPELLRSEVFKELTRDISPISVTTIPQDDDINNKNVESFSELQIGSEWDF